MADHNSTTAPVEPNEDFLIIRGGIAYRRVPFFFGLTRLKRVPGHESHCECCEDEDY